jgi:hypothetical protein
MIKALSIDGVDEEGHPDPFSSSELANPVLERHFQVLEVSVSVVLVRTVPLWVGFGPWVSGELANLVLERHFPSAPGEPLER